METLLFSLMVVLPLLFFMLVGLVAKKYMPIADKTIVDLTALTFRILIPCNLFLSIYRADAFAANIWQIVLYAIVSSLIVFFVFWLFYHKTEADKSKKSALILNVFYTNLSLFGVVLSDLILGEQATGLLGLLLAFIIPLHNILAVFIVSYYSGEKANVKQVIINIIKNPFIIAVAIAFVVKGLKFTVPTVVLTVVEGFAASASPIALLALGARFKLSELGSNKTQIISGTITRLLLVPVLGILPAVALGFRGESVVALLAIFASPVAISSVALASEMKADGTLATQLLIFTTIFCIFTLFLWIFMLRAAGIF